MTNQGTAQAVADSTAESDGDRLRLERWSCTLGSNVMSRATIVIASGDKHWSATARGDGPVEVLFRAVDSALHDVLTGHPRLLSYDVHAIAEGPDAEGTVSVTIAPPSDAPGDRSSGTYSASATSANIIAASIEAYIAAIQKMLREEHWQDATEEADGSRSRTTEAGERPHYDPREQPDHSRWWV
jgi:2-isopropylmalate synthase